MMGKELRLKRISGRNGRFVLVPLDHGVTLGPTGRLLDLPGTISKVAEGGATGIICNKGTILSCKEQITGRLGVVTLLSASTKLGPDPNEKVTVGTVEDAIRLGADAVACYVNLGSSHEPDMLHELGQISSDCIEWGMPLIGYLTLRGPSSTNAYDPVVVSHCARIGAELGADVVKINYTGDPVSFRDVVNQCPVPVIIAGEAKSGSDEKMLSIIRDSLDAGGKGVSMGRTIFQHENITGITRAICALVLEDLGVKDALKILKK